MNKIKKLSIAVVALAMCVLLGATVWATATNVTFEAALNQTSFCQTDVEQTAVVTLKADKQIDLFSLDADLTVPAGWTVKSVTHPTLDVSYNKGNIIWAASAPENQTTDVLAIITVEIPKNTSIGKYSISVTNLEITKINASPKYDIDYWVSGATVTTEVEVKNHSYTPGEYVWSADYSSCSVVGTCACGDTYLASAEVRSKLTKDPSCEEKGEHTYTATFGPIWAKEQVKVVADVPEKGHSFTTKASNQLASAADCENAATYYVQCDNCTAVDTGKTVAVGTATGHAYPATPSYTNDGDTHTETFVCGNDASHVITNTGLEHDFTNGDCACGAAALTVVKKGNTINYTVSGRVVTVTCVSPCKVGYLEGGKYVTTGITQTKVSDTSYSFTIPAGASEVLIVVKGDVTGDGNVNAGDRARLARAVALANNPNRLPFTEAWETFVADTNEDGNVNAGDRARLARAVALANNPNRLLFAW